MKPLTLSAAALLLLAGCGDQTPEIEDTIGDTPLVRHLFAHFGDEDPLAMQQGIEALEVALEPVDLEGDKSVRRFDELETLRPEDWGTATMWADSDPLDQVVAGLAGRSAWPPADHAELALMTDQTPIESSSSETYDRTVNGDGSCFPTGDCARLDTTNEVHRDNILLDIWYETPKIFRWFDLSDGRQAIVATGWLEEPYTGDSGANTLEQFSVLDVRIPDADGGTTMYSVIWGAIDPPLDETIARNTTVNGIDEAWTKTDAYLDAR